VVHRAEVGLPQVLGQPAEEDHEPEAGEDLRQHGRVDDAPDDRVVERRPEGEEQERRERQREDRVELPQGEAPEAGVHAQHQELAVGEVHDVHDAEDQRQAHGHQRVDQADEDAGEERLEQELRGHLEPPPGALAPLACTGAPPGPP
jgi:hypothetical protein